MKASSIALSSCGVSDIGLVRSNNEDTWAELPEERFYLLADGMGGHQAGEIASRETLEVMCRSIKKKFKSQPISFKEAVQTIHQIIDTVNGHIYKLGRANPVLKGMGTTLCLIYFHPEGVILAHVGDSRIYRYRSGQLKLMTKDHSLLTEMLEKGQLESPEESFDFHYKNIITKAIGTEPHVQPSFRQDELHSTDIYLLCSDGLSDLLTQDEIEQALKTNDTLSKAALQLVSLSKKKGAHDNITLLLIQVIVT